MAKLSIVAGTTSDSELIFIQDSSSTTGAGRTGLAFNTAGLSATYTFARQLPVTITFATLTATTAAYSSGGFIELNTSIMAGWYRFDTPNAALAAGNGRKVAIHFFGAASMAPVPVEIELTGWDNQIAQANTTIAAAASITGLTVGFIDTSITSRMATYTQPTGFLSATFPAGTVANTTNITAGTITQTGDFTLQLTESYRANGAAPTPAQALCEILGHLGESSIAAVTKTVKKFDHATTAETFTLSDSIAPIAITRAT